MRLTFLGTGTSFGVPVIGCDCAACMSSDPRDRRTRHGAVLEVDGARMLIDTPPELRLQLLANGIDRIDAIWFTHMHADHVGWNTRLQDGHWVPTFPNAKYLFSQIELDGMLEQTGNPFDEYLTLVYEDSVLPIIQSGQSVVIDSDFDLGKGINLLPTPGHSPGHYCIELKAKNVSGILTGDVLHNPIQVAYPKWTTMFCEDKEKANETRMKLVDDLTDSNIIVLAAHFSGTTAGKIVSDPKGTKFNLLD